MRSVLPLLSVLLLLVDVPLVAQFTVAEALSAPFSNQLTAAPAKARVAWFTDDRGRRNVWVAGTGQAARPVSYARDDDGQDIDDIAWSCDAEQIAWTRGTGTAGSEHALPANPAELPGPVQQHIELADLRAAAGSPVRTIAEGHTPLFLADGTHLLFLRRGSIWVADLSRASWKASSAATASDAEEIDARQPARQSSALRQLLFVRGTAHTLRLSPDGSQLAFVSDRGDHSFIGVYTFRTRALTWMDPGTGMDHDPVWSPDGRRIAFVREVPIVSDIADRWMREGQPWSIRVAEVSSGMGRELWRADAGAGSLFHGVSAHDQLIWLHDGRIVFPWEKGGWTRLYALPAIAADATQHATVPELLSSGDAEVDTVASDGSRVVWSSNAEHDGHDAKDVDRRHVFSAGGGGTQLTRGHGIETEPAILSDGTLALLHGDAQSPLVPSFMGDHGSLRPYAPQLVPASFPAAQFVEPQQVIFSAADGLKIHGQLFVPGHVRPGAKLPAVVFFHGGSRRQMLLGFHPMQYYHQAYEFNQYLASRGFLVLSVNYRSGVGYGLNFRQALHYGANGGTEDNDVVGAANYLRSRADVDPRRISAWGGSYGGYLTALALARHSDLYAAGVDLHGVHDWSLELNLSKPTDEPGVDQTAIAQLAFRSSPMASLDTWKSPVLLIQGDDDRNVLFAQTVRLAAELRKRGVPVKEKVFPDEVHDFLLHRNWITAFELTADFLERQAKITGGKDKERQAGTPDTR